MGPEGKKPNIVNRSSAFEDTGSVVIPARSVQGTLALRVSMPLGRQPRLASGSSGVSVRPPREDPLERALRLQAMVEELGTQAAVARKLRCSGPWISKALRVLQKAAPSP